MRQLVFLGCQKLLKLLAEMWYACPTPPINDAEEQHNHSLVVSL